MIRNISILLLNDLAVSVRSKSIFLVFFIPLFVFVAMSLIDNHDGKNPVVRVGLVSGDDYEPKMVGRITGAVDLVKVTWVDSKQSGIALLNDHALDGMLLPGGSLPGNLVLLVLRKESPGAIAVVETLAALHDVEVGARSGWITDIEALHKGGVQRQALPTWILLLVLLVSFIVIPAQVAEEKEKKLLLALLQTPVSETEWLLAKLGMGVILIMAAVVLLHFLSNFFPDCLFRYMALIVVGSFCFCTFGIFLGLLCRNQASARTLGMIFYLPMLLPSALSDVSEKLNMAAPLLPSYYFYVPVRSILLDEVNLSGFISGWIYLLLLGVLMFCLSIVLIRKRWLM